MGHAHSEALQGSVSDVISSLGTAMFGHAMLRFLHGQCGIDHCAVFRMREEDIAYVASTSLDGSDSARRQAKVYVDHDYWRRDPMLAEAQMQARRRPALIWANVDELADLQLREAIFRPTRVRERVLMFAEEPRFGIGVSVLRSDNVGGSFSADEVAQLRQLSSMLLPLAAKHAQMLGQTSSVIHALTSLSEIEERIQSAPQKLPAREAQVCARMLYGLQSAGIAADLGIGEESVLTYRKRAYQRLRIGSQRDLLLWYLSLWSAEGATAARH